MVRVYFVLALMGIVLMLYFYKQRYAEIDHPAIIATIFTIILLLVAIFVDMLNSMWGIIIVCYAAILFPDSINELIIDKYIVMAGWMGLLALLLIFLAMGIYLERI